MLAGARAAGGAHAGKTGDRREEATDVERLTAPRVHGLVRQSGERQHAAERRGDEVGGLPMRAGAGAAEGRERHLHEPRVGDDEVGVVEMQVGETAGCLGLDDQVGSRGEAPVRRLIGASVEVECESRLAAVVPPVEQPTAGGGIVRAHGRPV